MVVAACALLVGSGRADFTETELLAEVERLAAELRQRWGFNDEERADGTELWAAVLERLGQIEVQHASYAPRRLTDDELAYHFRSLYSPGLANGRLWLTREAGAGGGWSIDWTARRYRHLLDQLLEDLHDAPVKVAFMAIDPRENGGA